jgi:hypothetical protein
LAWVESRDLCCNHWVITFDAVELNTGEVWRGRLWSPGRAPFRRWLAEEVTLRAKRELVAMAVEGCTGWRYVVEEITAAGFEAHLAEPADIQAARGRKRHAKTDRSDARLPTSAPSGSSGSMPSCSSTVSRFSKEWRRPTRWPSP